MAALTIHVVLLWGIFGVSQAVGVIRGNKINSMATGTRMSHYPLRALYQRTRTKAAVVTEWFNPAEKYELSEEIKRGEGPIILYVPGVDGTGLTPFAQYAEICSKYDLMCLSLNRSERCSFSDIQDMVKKKIAEYKSEGREVWLIGESFGGIVSLSLGMGSSDERSTPDRIITVNSASAFDRTFYGRISPGLITLPEPFFTMAVIPVGFLVLDQLMFQNIAQASLMAANGIFPDILKSPERQEFISKIAPDLIESMLLRSDDLRWRVANWVLPGCSEVNPRLSEVKVPVLAVAGTQDLLLPSKEEAMKFKEEIPSCEVILIEGAGHAGTLDQRTDLTSIIESWVKQ